MCGFTGFWTQDPEVLKFKDAVINRMSEQLIHRGPDDQGTWHDHSLGLALGFRRLAIMDLSAAGHQPMESPTGRFILTFNGEIYNHQELRNHLGSNFHFRGHSDTETLLVCFEVLGIEETLRKSIGMFALSIWDIKTQTLHLARDRVGEKPLYYGWTDSALSTFVFGSELKALKTYPGFSNPISKDALTQFLRFTYVPAPYSIYRNIFKLEPGCILSIKGNLPPAPITPLRPDSTYHTLHIKKWWSLSSVVSHNNLPVINSMRQASQGLEKLLADSVRIQSLADVPLGAFLSGGVDSSTIVAMMQKESMRKVKTFTVGFEDTNFDESPYAKAVANHLGTDHHEIYLSSLEAQQVIPNLATIYDEPFADSSQIPTHLVCKSARSQVTVALSGDGGDELFGGYNRYFWGPRIWGHLNKLPFVIRQKLGATILAFPEFTWELLGNRFNSYPSISNGVQGIGGKAHKLAQRLNTVKNFDDLYLSLVTEWQNPELLIKYQETESPTFTEKAVCILNDPLPETGLKNSQLNMMYKDTLSYLPDDILCKVDRAAMSVSLETRIPFLDHRIVEFAWSLPLNLKIQGQAGKQVLREVLYKYVPKELIDRPKAGFAVPIGQWLRGPLLEWADELLNEARINREGYFHAQPIRQRWLEHLSLKRDHTPSLWTILMFQAWLDKSKQ